MAFEDLEPVDAGDDYRVARLSATVANIAGSKMAGRRDPTPLDFLPGHLKPKETVWQKGMRIKAAMQHLLALSARPHQSPP